ncbi:MAG TPA: pyruvate, water dikinase regulatory protein [Trueperaceae bacterium]|nr:pyruvate, water dikinase regulatory protein [Trueperaceae bacterium]
MNATQVYFVSDHTGVTAEVLGHSLLARFGDVPIHTTTRPFVNTLRRADALAAELAGLAESAVVFSTITDIGVRERIAAAPCVHLDLFEPFLGPLERVFGSSPQARVGAYHSIRDLASYQARIDSVEFALATDDGSNVRRYGQAEVVMVGVSRVGKSPTCLYLALQYGVRAANYPLAEDDFESDALPESLVSFKGRLFGLTIAARRLHELRQQRRPGSGYAELRRCEYEVRRAERLFRRHAIPFQDTSTLSVEELAALVLQRAGLERHR